MENEVTPKLRPTKKQKELLEFIAEFVKQHGYGPSYREIMVGCNYTSVATVAVHVRNLITRGHIRKNGRSARSLEIIGMDSSAASTALPTNVINPDEEKWLVEKIDYLFQQNEASPQITNVQINDLQVLVQALKVLGLEGASLSFSARLKELKKRTIEDTL